MRPAVLYYKQPTLDRHARLADDMLGSILAEHSYESDWRPLRKRLADLTLTRNIIVHHPPLRTGSSKRRKAIYSYGIHVEPYERLLGKRYDGLKGKSSLEIQDLKQHAEEVETLPADLALFLKKLTQAHNG